MSNRMVRAIGISKNQFAEFMNAIEFNLKSFVVLSEEVPTDIAYYLEKPL